MELYFIKNDSKINESNYLLFNQAKKSNVNLY